MKYVKTSYNQQLQTTRPTLPEFLFITIQTSFIRQANARIFFSKNRKTTEKQCEHIT